MPAAPASLSAFVTVLIAVGVQRMVARLPGVDKVVAKAVMHEVADELCGRYAGLEFYVPAAHAQRLHTRNALIQQRYREDGAQGVAAGSAARIKQLAGEFELTARQVRTIVGSARASGATSAPQPSTQQGRRTGRMNRNPS